MTGFLKPWGQYPRTLSTDQSECSRSVERDFCPHGLKSPQSRNVGACSPTFFFVVVRVDAVHTHHHKKIYCPRRGREKPKRRLLRSPYAAIGTTCIDCASVL